MVPLSFNRNILPQSEKRNPIQKFEHVRHKPPTELVEERPLVVACSPLRSNINLSTIFRTAGCCGVKEIIATGNARLIGKIARDGADRVTLIVKNSLPPVLKRLKEDGFTLVGLEQSTNSTPLAEYDFLKKTALVIGAEREGLSNDCLTLLDAVVEIPVWGLPYSYNVATATSMALYEYCRQYPAG